MLSTCITYPDINIISYPSIQAALEAVATGEADATHGSLAILNYLIQTQSLTNVVIAARSDIQNPASKMGIRKDAPELQAILSKALEAIPSIFPETRVETAVLLISVSPEFAILE